MILSDIRPEAASVVSHHDVTAIRVLSTACAPYHKEPVATGIVSFDRPSLRWRLRTGVLIYVLEGVFRLKGARGLREATPGDTLWLPPGTLVSYEGSRARVFFAAYTHHWRDALVHYE